MDSQQLPHEEGFSMTRPNDLSELPPSTPETSQPMNSPSNLSGIFPSCKVSEEDGTVHRTEDITAREMGGPVVDLLSEVIERSSSFSQDPINHQDAGWNLPDPNSKEDEDIMDNEDSGDVGDGEPAAVAKESSCRVLVSLNAEDEFLRDSDHPLPLSSQEKALGSGPDSFPPPNQLACRDAPVSSSSSPVVLVNSVSVPVLARPHKRFRSEVPKISLRGSTRICEDANPLGARITSAIGRAEGFCPVVVVSKNEEEGFLQHDFISPVSNIPPMPVIPDPSPREMGEDRFLSVRETARGTTLRTVRSEPQIVFFLFIYDRDGRAYVPSISTFDLIVNKMEIHVMSSRPDLLPFSWNAERWGSCGVLELAQEPQLEEWRSALSKLVLEDEIMADTFPKDSLLCGPDVSALLKDPYWTYDLGWFARSLTYRNKTLKGYVRTVLSKVYEPHDYTRHGVCMDTWRLVYLQGDCVFMEHLSKFPSNYRFKAGPSTAVLRGGIRQPSFLVEPSRTQYTWIRCPILPSEPVKPTDPLPLSRLTLSSSSSSSGILPGDSTSSIGSVASVSAPGVDVSAGAGADVGGKSKFPLVKSSSLPSGSSTSLLDDSQSAAPTKKAAAAAAAAARKNAAKSKPKPKPKYKSERQKAARAKKACC